MLTAQENTSGKTVDPEMMQDLFALQLNLAAVRAKKDLSGPLYGLGKLMDCEEIAIALKNEDGRTYSKILYYPEMVAGLVCYPMDDFFLIVMHAAHPQAWDLAELQNGKRCPDYIRNPAGPAVKRLAAMSLRPGGSSKGAIFFTSAREEAFQQAGLQVIRNAAAQLSVTLTNIAENERLLAEINRYKRQLTVENPYLQEELSVTQKFGEIVGASAPMREVFQLVSQVSDSESTVVLLGETGTGKELIARAIHHGSPRRDKVMIKVNCAALPASLIETELFGHEKGSFTGATERRLGKFELANNSTLFLDEVGELPIDLQAKLLRALQEKEIERVGGKTVIKTNVRIVAATNRDLKKEVQLGRFRSDLYFRLNVFPIIIPALRDRKEDIPILATHFLFKHVQQKGKGTMRFSSRAVKELVAYSWPGNVRELEHLIERSILVNRGSIIRKFNLPPSDETKETDVLAPWMRIKTIDEVEREHIIAVLKLCRGKVAGIGGAAEALKIPATTLNSKIRRLKIKKALCLI
jgi:formate hydrogenlyase transcriptional activator